MVGTVKYVKSPSQQEMISSETQAFQTLKIARLADPQIAPGSNLRGRHNLAADVFLTLYIHCPYIYIYIYIHINIYTKYIKLQSAFMIMYICIYINI
jgi:hypothetical protein